MRIDEGAIITDSTFVYTQYSEGTAQETFAPAPLPGSTAITTLQSLTGPTLTLSGGTTGYSFTPAGTVITLTGSAAGAAPATAQYVTLATDATLTAERVLTGTASQITITDNGAGSTVVLSLPATITVATAYQVASTQVVSSRKTGWGAASGTLSRAAYASYAGQTVSNPPTQAEMQALDDAVKLLSRTVAALITDLTSHGLIGS